MNEIIICPCCKEVLIYSSSGICPYCKEAILK